MQIIIELRSSGEKIKGVLTGSEQMIKELIEATDKLEWGSTSWYLTSESPLNDVGPRISA